MGVLELLRWYQGENGWTDATALAILCDYINQVVGVQAFEAHMDQRIIDENNMLEDARVAEERAFMENNS